MLDEKAITALLYEEARAMDEHRYADWLGMWTQDAVYWVPCRHEATDPDREVSIIYDTRQRLVDRVERLRSGSVLAQEPPPRLRRVLSNNLTRSDAVAFSNFLLVQALRGEQVIWCGHTQHRLRCEDDRVLISRKTVFLVNSEQEMPLLQFLL
jgi:3-phenylpropionate/cinnamic acid dioxygenase small subunit